MLDAVTGAVAGEEVGGDDSTTTTQTKAKPGKEKPSANADEDADDGAAGDAGADGGDAGGDGEGADGDADAGADAAAGEDGADAEAGDEGADAAGEGDEGAGEEEGNEDEFAPPKGLKERSAKRWEGLVSRTKQAETVASNFRQVLNDTGASREDISRTLHLLHLINKGGKEGLREALNRIDGERARIAKMLGVEVPGVDLLADFPDLVQEVEDMKITRERGLELAAARRTRQQLDNQGRQERENGQRQAQIEDAKKKAFQDLDTLGEELANTDVDYDAKFKVLKDNGELNDIIQTFHPSQWATQFRRRYNLLSRAGGGQRNKPAVKQKPLRPTGQGGGGSAAPKSLSEAVNLAVAGTGED